MKSYKKEIAVLAAMALFTPWASAQYTDSNGDTIVGTVTGQSGTDLVADINAAGTLIQIDVDQNETDSDDADTAIRGEFAAADTLIQNDVDQNETDSDDADALLQADINAEVADRSELISSTGTNADGKQIVHIGDNSLITEELDGTQRLRAEDGDDSAIDIQFDGEADVLIDNKLTVGAVTTATTSSSTDNNVVGKVEVPGGPVDTEFFITRDYDRTDEIATNGNTLIDENGNITTSAGTTTTQGGQQILQFAAKYEVFPDGHPSEGLPITATQEYVAVYEDPSNPGSYIEAAIPGGPFADAPALEAGINAMSIADFEALVSGLNNYEQTTVEDGGNLQVGGNANVDGVLSLAGDADPDGDPLTDDGYAAVGNVAEAIGTNADDIAATQADVDQNEADSDAADTLIRGEFAAADDVVRGEFAAADDVVRGEFAAADDVVRGEFAAADDVVRGEFAAADAILQGQITSNANSIANNREDIDRNTRGIAMVAALQHTTVLPGMTHALDVSAAHFEGETGMALNYARRINDNVQINFGAASTSDFDESVIKAGIGVQW